MPRLKSIAPYSIGLALLLAGCASSSPDIGGAPGLEVVAGDALPEPTVADLAANERPYRVGPFDILTIDVFGSEELSKKEVQVDASGRMTFPLIGTLEVAGRTPGEVGEMMADRFRGRYIHDPQVTVNLKEIVSQTVTISGEVKKAGVYPIVGRMTLMTAIASAEGWTEFSKKGEVVVLRTVEGQDYAALYDVRAIEKGRYADPEIFASDVVVVGNSNSRRIFKDFLAATPLLAPVVLLLDRNN
ncbi:polysaccharide export protein [Altererythrobacter sp. BO-6]|uniref:polysaccharide biosynthesis/export family protein n=1 Tax=Altererythrobacter sp. BO-6 TaxID=2604537 RepID=UPI0013E1EC2F|nr:polysaccharide biosynthesis/export family protein [Altererythrobacter sp. BO-6]QIG54279.1 polysaccharide export protein [Altererythrobacter sp. BO-6]